MGGAGLVARRTNSVQQVVQPVGVGTPTSQPVAGMSVTSAIAPAFATPIVVAALPPDRSVVDTVDRQYYGSKPSGLGEAWNHLFQRYTKDNAGPLQYVEDAAKRGAAKNKETVDKINADLAARGLPQIPFVSGLFQKIVGEESVDQGNAGNAGIQGVQEMMPAWRADP